MRLLHCLVCLSLLCITAFPSCVHYSSHQLKIEETESDDTYTFYASFPKEKTDKVHEAVNKSMSPNGLFASVNDYLDVTTSLQDKTNFAVKASPGLIKVTLDKKTNSTAAYNRVKNMCAGIKDALKD